MSNESTPLLKFRADDIRYVMQCVLTGKSCILVGVDGMGKTELMRALASERVHDCYLQGSKDRFIFCALDSHELSKPTAQAYYRRMASLLEPAMLRSGLASEVTNIPMIMDEELARQVLFDRVDLLLRQYERVQLVFLFDEFDVAFTEVEPHFFRVLHALCARANRRICYVAACNNVPALICDVHTRKIVRDMFAELFSGNIRGIKPYARWDTYLLVKNALLPEEQNGSREDIGQLLIEITGAHPGMSQAVVAAITEEDYVGMRERDSSAQLIELLLQNMGVISACEQLWNSLSEIEHDCLKLIQRGVLMKATLLQQYSVHQINELLYYLVLKGILVRDKHNYALYHSFSPLFTAYILQRFSSFVPGLQLDVPRRQVWIDGVLRASHLTVKEFKLFSFLASRAGEVCPREETAQAVYDEPYSPKQDDARLDALVERARRRIGDNSHPARFLETMRGVGHRLNEYLGERGLS